MLKGFSVQQVLGAAGPANSVLFLDGTSVPKGVSGLTFNGTSLALTTASGNLLIGATSNLTGGSRRAFTLNSAAGQLSIIEFGVNNTLAGYIFANDSQLTLSANGALLSPITFETGAAERMRITANGNVVAGGSAALATNAENGFLYVPTCAGTPTGVPTAITGMAPIVVDTTNNKLYFYSGGWRDAGP